jgi:mannose-6-phosphate isomerase-like protein (cupin superfamily)
MTDDLKLYKNPRCDRPWGLWEVLEVGNRFKVKRLVVNPGMSISLQRHLHRSEHWTVVEGTAIVSNGTDAKVLTENESTYIPLGGIHRLMNPGKIPLVVIEVQCGSYLEEDDIERLDG